MIIECTYGPVTTEVMGTSYTFAPDEYGRNVAEVWIPKHIQAFLNVVHYQRVDKEPGVPDVLTLTEMEPTSAIIGDDDLTLVLTGTGFTADSIIVFNGGDEPTTLMSDTQVATIVKPSTAGVSGAYPVLVREGGVETDALEFTFYEAPEADAQDAEDGGAETDPETDALLQEEDIAPISVLEITGIGPAMQTKLESEGITDARQIAELTEDEANALDERLGLGGRIARDDWVGQAKALVG